MLGAIFDFQRSPRSESSLRTFTLPLMTAELKFDATVRPWFYLNRAKRLKCIAPLVPDSRRGAMSLKTLESKTPFHHALCSACLGSSMPKRREKRTVQRGVNFEEWSRFGAAGRTSKSVGSIRIETLVSALRSHMHLGLIP